MQADSSAEVTRAIVVVPVLPTRPGGMSSDTDGSAPMRPSVHSPDARLCEARGLANAIHLNVTSAFLVNVTTPRPSTLFGQGKVDELARIIEEHRAEVVVVDHAISPVQQRNLEMAWNAKVLDRTGLILEIFGARARTREGRLQVELAHLTYQKGRLVRAWTHLERQRGGAGFLGGPGEAQIELDRRMLTNRMSAIKRELANVVKTRELHRAGRRKVPYPVVAIVGYTNAGKSTLFNHLTGASVLAQDQVFATLDPTMREVRLPSGRRIILSDTVGFISDLPTMLVAAFRATLEEVVEADLILHVRDASDEEMEAQRLDVEHVLGDLGIETDGPQAHILEVWNKIDLLSHVTLEEAKASARWSQVKPILVSAQNGDGCNALLEEIDQCLGGEDVVLTVTIPAQEGQLLHWLYENGDVLERDSDEVGQTICKVRIVSEKQGRVLAGLQSYHVTVN